MGTTYTTRLENCIKTVNWTERLAEELGCEYIINLGDFFDKPDLTSETITACNDIEWSNIMHYSLVGNHDASTSSLLFNSANSLQHSHHKIVTEPSALFLDDCTICFLPYVLECDRKSLKDYFGKIDTLGKPIVILSHNDISGIQLGPVMSKTGFTVEDIEANCALFINGHLHNGQQLTNKIINLGNITGKDFGEDAFRHSHNVAVLDTATLEITFIENPYAFNFYKVNITDDADLLKLSTLKDNAIVSIKCEHKLLNKVKEFVKQQPNIIEHRIIITRTLIDTDEEEASVKELQVDHLARFVECCRATIDNTQLLEEEIAEICK